MSGFLDNLIRAAVRPIAEEAAVVPATLRDPIAKTEQALDKGLAEIEEFIPVQGAAIDSPLPRTAQASAENVTPQRAPAAAPKPSHGPASGVVSPPTATASINPSAEPQSKEPVLRETPRKEAPPSLPAPANPLRHAGIQVVFENIPLADPRRPQLSLPRQADTAAPHDARVQPAKKKEISGFAPAPPGAGIFRYVSIEAQSNTDRLVAPIPAAQAALEPAPEPLAQKLRTASPITMQADKLDLEKLHQDLADRFAAHSKGAAESVPAEHRDIVIENLEVRVVAPPAQSSLAPPAAKPATSGAWDSAARHYLGRL